MDLMKGCILNEFIFHLMNYFLKSYQQCRTAKYSNVIKLVGNVQTPPKG